MLTELLSLLTDPAHLAFEVITDLAFAGVGVIWHALWVRRHDARVHPERRQAVDVRYTDIGAPRVRQALVCNEEHPCDRCIEEGRG